MTISKQNQYDRFRRSVEFLNQRSEEFAPDAKALAFLGELQGVVTGLDDIVNASASEKEAGRSTPSKKLAALNELRGELAAIERTASAIAAENPKFKNSYALPDRRCKDELVATAKTFLRSAKPVKKKFEEFEMSGHFLERLQERIEAVEAAQNVKSAGGGKEEQKEGVEKINELVAEGEKLVGFLDVVLGNKYRGEAEKLEAWRGAAAVELRRRNKKG
jgi:hypothetical protein